MATTPIRSLVLMIETAAVRQHSIDDASKGEDWTQGEWSAASRVWSRQQHALASAIIEEPPQNFDDVLAVLVHLANRHDLILGMEEDVTERELRNLRQMTGVAIKNCVIRLAGMFRPDEEITETLHADIACFGKQVGQWLPPALPVADEQGDR